MYLDYTKLDFEENKFTNLFSFSGNELTGLVVLKTMHRNKEFEFSIEFDEITIIEEFFNSIINYVTTFLISRNNI